MKLNPVCQFHTKLLSIFVLDLIPHKIDAIGVWILQGPLATDDLEFSTVLDVTGISQGPHKVKVEMYELWSASKKLAYTSKEAQ